jgi:hypothetical protein
MFNGRWLQMNFVSALLGALQQGFNFIGDMIFEALKFLAKPLSYVFYFIEGIFYFIYQLFNIVVKIIMIFVALIQFFVAIVAGFMRTVIAMLTINYSAVPPVYPGGSYQGVQVVLDLLQPTGILTVVPYIILAIIWFGFVKKMIGLIGGGGAANE